MMRVAAGSGGRTVETNEVICARAERSICAQVRGIHLLVQGEGPRRKHVGNTGDK